MMLESMVVSRDWQEVSVLECILGSLQIGVRVEADVERAHRKLSKSKVDAIIVDRDLSGTDRLIESLRAMRFKGGPLPLVLLSGSRGRHDLATSGATFFFEKPISVDQALETLSATRNLILNGRLRYHREPVDVPAWLSFGKRKHLSVELVNLSQGGVGIRSSSPVDARGPVNVRFVLPGTDFVVKARGELAWSDRNGNAGIRFLKVSEQIERSLERWLEKQYFARSDFPDWRT